MSFPDDVRKVVMHFVDALENGGMDYMLIGGFAVPIWGIPRATYDVDITLSVDEAGMVAFLDLI